MDDNELQRMADDAREEVEQEFIRRRRRMQDFRYDEVQNAFWDTTTGLLLSGKSVDGAIPREFWPTRPDGRNGRIRPFEPSLAINDVDTGLTVEGSTWWPGQPQFIEDTIVTERGAIHKRGAITYNSYHAPDRDGLRRGDATPWVEHVKTLYPSELEHEHFFNFAAHMIQRADQKVNHGIVLAGKQGIGKDTMMLPLRKGVGEWNTYEIEPDAITTPYNPYVKSVLLVINEVRPHDEDFKASNFYNKLKPLLAAPPDMLPMRVLYQNAVFVRNLCHVVLTTNDPLTMYIPAEDRRLFVMTSPLPDPKVNPVFPDDYFSKLYAWMAEGGADAVIGWLLDRDISRWNAQEPPPMTRGKAAIIVSAKEVRRSPVDEVFESFAEKHCGGQKPDIVFMTDLLQFVNGEAFFDDKEKYLKALQNRNLPFKMDERGYAMVKNPDASEWRNGKFRSRVVFVSTSIPDHESIDRIFNELRKRPLELKF